MSSLDKTGSSLVTVEDLNNLYKEVQATERENPTDEQMKSMKLPELLQLQQQLQANLNNKEACLRAFYEKLRQSVTQPDQTALSLVASAIYPLAMKDKVSSEINQALKSLTASGDSQPLKETLLRLFSDYSTQKPLLNYLKATVKQLFSLVKDFGQPFEFSVSCQSIRPVQAEILSLLPIQKLTFHATYGSQVHTHVPSSLCDVIPEMQSLTSLDTQVISYPEVVQVYNVAKKITDLACRVSYKEKKHISDIVARMPDLQVLELHLSSNGYLNSWDVETAALKNAKNLREITLNCEWCLPSEQDVSEILANLPAGCKKVTIISGRLDAANPRIIERFTDNKIEELSLYKCSSTLNNALIANKISILKVTPVKK